MNESLTCLFYIFLRAEALYTSSVAADKERRRKATASYERTLQNQISEVRERRRIEDVEDRRFLEEQRAKDNEADRLERRRISRVNVNESHIVFG